MLINKSKLIGLAFIHILILTVIAGVSSARSQSYQKEPLTWGMKAGVNYSDLLGEDAQNSNLQTNFSGGILFNYRFSKLWALQPEVLFTINGAELKTGLTGENGSAKYEFGYANIPLFAKYYFPTGGRVNPNLYAGPEVGFKIYGDSNNKNIDDELKNAVFGIAFGAGLDFNVGSKSTDFIRTIGLDLRYSLGLTNVFDTSKDSEVRSGTLFTAVFLGF